MALRRLQFPALPGQTTRPQPKLHERYVYHMQGVGVSGSAAKLDAPILRQRDTNGDGLLTDLDQTIYYMQNVRGDVVGVAAGDGKLLEFVRYTAHGWPTVIPRSIADIVSIGGFPPWDGNLTVDDYTSFIDAFIEGSLLADITAIGGLGMPDGEVTVDDYTAFINAFAEDSALAVTQGVLSVPPGDEPAGPYTLDGVDNRIGYAGYWCPPRTRTSRSTTSATASSTPAAAAGCSGIPSGRRVGSTSTSTWEDGRGSLWIRPARCPCFSPRGSVPSSAEARASSAI